MKISEQVMQLDHLKVTYMKCTTIVKITDTKCMYINNAMQLFAVTLHNSEPIFACIMLI